MRKLIASTLALAGVAVAAGPAAADTWSAAYTGTIIAPAAAAGGAATCIADKNYEVGDSFDGKDATGAFHAVINAGR